MAILFGLCCSSCLLLGLGGGSCMTSVPLQYHLEQGEVDVDELVGQDRAPCRRGQEWLARWRVFSWQGVKIFGTRQQTI